MKVNIKDIVDLIKPEAIALRGNEWVKEVTSLKSGQFSDSSLSWVNQTNIARLQEIHSGTIICGQVDSADLPDYKCNYLICQNPRRAFAEVIREFFAYKSVAGISKSALIHESVMVGKEVFIGENVVLEADCVVGDRTVISHNTVIKARTILGNDVRIGSNNTIGGVGFGYERDESGEYQIIHHIGNVVLEDHVEIGSNTTIDRAVLGSTILRKNVKVDNLVHIAHGVEVGENSLVIANAMVAGSVKIGANVWVAPSSAIINQIQIEDDAVIGMGAVVLKPVAKGDTIIGNPGKSLTALRKNAK